MSSNERILRWRPPICWGDTVDSADAPADDEWDDGENLDVDSDDGDRLDEDEDMYGCLVLCLNCPIVAVFLIRRMNRAAPQSMKAKVAPFHNFILECGGALKLCWERRDRQMTDIIKQPDLRAGKPSSQRVTLKQREQCKSCYNPCRHICLTSTWNLFSQQGFCFTVSLLFLMLLAAHFHLKWVHELSAWQPLLTTENAVCV